MRVSVRERRGGWLKKRKKKQGEERGLGGGMSPKAVGFWVLSSPFLFSVFFIILTVISSF